MNSQQLGKFFISEELIRNNPDIVAEAFKDMRLVVVRAESQFINRELQSAGISPHFKEIPRGMIIPSYLVHIFSNEAEGEGPEYSHVEVTPL